jgi:hypothetical protein
MTGIALGCVGATSAFGAVVRKAKMSFVVSIVVMKKRRRLPISNGPSGWPVNHGYGCSANKAASDLRRGCANLTPAAASVYQASCALTPSLSIEASWLVIPCHPLRKSHLT